jgi:hypothetical protein
MFEFRTVVEADKVQGSSDSVELEMVFPKLKEHTLRVMQQPDLVIQKEDVLRVVIKEISDRPNFYDLSLHFTSQRASDLERLTSARVGQRLAMVVQKRILMAPKVMEPITNGQLLVSLGEPLEEVQKIARMLPIEPIIDRNPPPEDKPRPYKYERSPLSEEEMAKIMVSDDWIALRRSYIWSQPTETSSPIFLLSASFFVKQEVQILTQAPWIQWVYKNDWVKVVYDDKKGWVPRKDLVPQYILLHTDVLLKYYKEMLEEWVQQKKDPQTPPWQLAKLQQTLEMYKQEAIRRFASETDFQKWYREIATPALEKARVKNP